MAVMNSKTLPEQTFNYNDFISSGENNDFTFDNFEISMLINGISIGDCNVMEFYIPEIIENCVKVTEFTKDEILRYKYNPDLLAWDVYKNTQLDYLILLCNDMCDPKEFDFKKGYLYLPKSSILKNLLSLIHNSESRWIKNSKGKSWLL